MPLQNVRDEDLEAELDELMGDEEQGDTEDELEALAVPDDDVCTIYGLLITLLHPFLYGRVLFAMLMSGCATTECCYSRSLIFSRTPTQRNLQLSPHTLAAAGQVSIASCLAVILAST